MYALNTMWHALSIMAVMAAVLEAQTGDFESCQRIINVKLKKGNIKPTESPFTSVDSNDFDYCCGNMTALAKADPKKASEQLCKAIVKRYKRLKFRNQIRARFENFFTRRITTCSKINGLLNFSSTSCSELPLSKTLFDCIDPLIAQPIGRRSTSVRIPECCRDLNRSVKKSSVKATSNDLCEALIKEYPLRDAKEAKTTFNNVLAACKSSGNDPSLDITSTRCANFVPKAT